MDKIKDGWFMETSSLWPDQAFSLKVESIIFHDKSKYQDVLVFETLRHGNVLVLDGVIQCTQADEFAYQEMMTHLTLSSHPNPKKVLVIGGGDGGIVREVVKHPEVESVTLCEIDEMVVDVSKRFLPYMSVGFSSPKLNLFIGDGFQFMKDHQKEFDVILTDSSDPEGPAEVLFQQEYFTLMKTALKDDGLLCSQGEGMWIDLHVIVRMNRFCREVFPVVDYAYSSVPSYTSGVIGYCLCSKNPETNFRKPVRVLDTKAFNLRYYNNRIHEAAFVLPEFAERALWQSADDDTTKNEGDEKPDT